MSIKGDYDYHVDMLYLILWQPMYVYVSYHTHTRQAKKLDTFYQKFSLYMDKLCVCMEVIIIETYTWMNKRFQQH